MLTPKQKQYIYSITGSFPYYSRDYKAWMMSFRIKTTFYSIFINTRESVEQIMECFNAGRREILSKEASLGNLIECGNFGDVHTDGTANNC